MSTEYSSNAVIPLYLSTSSGGSRGMAGEPSPYLILGKKNCRTEEKQAGKAKKNGPLP